MRLVADFVPESATACYDLSIHVLTSGTNNTRCLAHHFVRTEPKSDYTGDKNFKVMGTPFHKTPATQSPANQNAMNCGCKKERAVLEFYLYKTGKLRSEATNVEEGWLNQHLTPREREFVLKQVQEETLWSLDDIWRYRYIEEDGKWKRRSDLERFEGYVECMMKKLDNMKEAYKLAKGNAEDELDPETLQLLEESATEARKSKRARQAA